MELQQTPFYMVFVMLIMLETKMTASLGQGMCSFLVMLLLHCVVSTKVVWPIPQLNLSLLLPMRQ
jgi:hypothetical protein